VRWYSKTLHKQVRNVLRRFFTHLRERRVRDLRAVNEAHIIEYARLLAGTKTAKGTVYTAATQRSYVMTVQRLFRFLARQGVILQDPTLNLVLPTWKKLPHAVLNQAHARRLVASPDTLTPRGKGTARS
jgi:site-specific recombinase XerD